MNQKSPKSPQNKQNSIFEKFRTRIFFNISLFLVYGNTLFQIRVILETFQTYSILNQVQISGTEAFFDRINTIFTAITSQSYDPLAIFNRQFAVDFKDFQKEIEAIELGLQRHLKEKLTPIPSCASRLLVLKRFEVLRLDCLAMDRRYLDVAVMLEKEIETVKDIYNAGRADPETEWNISPVIGRIRWARSLFQKIDQPMQALKERDCVITHRKAQLCVKFYNYLSSVLLHYEMLYHKAWFDFAEQIRSKLEMPVLVKDTQTNRLKTNLHRYVPQLIHETEAMWKLGLEVPGPAEVLTYCKHKVIDACEQLKSYIQRNDRVRRAVPHMFLSLMKTQLLRLENAFAPGLSMITWVSQNLDDYFKRLNAALYEIESFVTRVNDIRINRIEVPIREIEDYRLITFPEKSLHSDELYDINSDHRSVMGRKMEIKSQAIEKALIDLINHFVEVTEVFDIDDQGKRRYQLPADEITDSNWRYEIPKPISKYDWLSFEKIYKAVAYPSPEDLAVLVFKDYDGLKYDVNLLHIDCMELFAYYNNKFLLALIRCTKNSLEALSDRTVMAKNELIAVEPMFLTHMHLESPVCVIKPSLTVMNGHYEKIMKNVVETNYSVSTWGKQAKVPERNKVKKTVGKSAALVDV